MAAIRPAGEADIAALLADLVTELVGQDTAAIVLGGSYGRREATRFSDVDLLHLTQDGAGSAEKTYLARDGYLVSIATRDLAWYRARLARPEQAIFLAPALLEARALYDPEGVFAAFQETLRGFEWAPLQPAADRFASITLVNNAEAVRKVLSAAERGDELTAFATVNALFFDLTLAVAVQRGCWITGNRPYLAQAREAAADAAWVAAHERFVASDAAELRRDLACHLYEETARLLRPAIQPDHRAVVEQTIGLLAAHHLA